MLRELLKDMLMQANAQKGAQIKRNLKSNLHLSLIAYENNVLFEISRDSIMPSDQEWKTCIEYFPYFVGSPKPEAGSSNMGRPSLKAYLPQNKVLSMFPPFKAEADEKSPLNL